MNKEYSPIEVALAILKKYQDLNTETSKIKDLEKESEEIKKALFAEQSTLSCSPPTENKESCANEIRWQLQRLKDLKELKWVIQDEAPEAKEIFEKQYKKIKSEISELIEKYNKLKKSDEDEEIITLAKAEIESDQCDIEETKLPKLSKEKKKEEYAKKVKAAREKIEKAFNVEKCGEMTKADEHIKGVHQQTTQFGVKQGVSDAGMEARRARMVGRTPSGKPKGDYFSAKESHRKVLAEQKEMKRPNLPKSEEASKPKQYSGEVGDVDPKIIDGMKRRLKEAKADEHKPREKVFDHHDDSSHIQVKKNSQMPLKGFLDKKAKKVAETESKIGLKNPEV